jgi:hypothetical protein
MKLQKIKTKKSTSTKVQNIKHTLQGIKTVGYINLIARNKVQTVNVKGIPQPKVFKTKTGRKLAILAIQAKQKVNKYASTLFNQSFVQVGIFEAKIAQAKKALKDAKKMYLTTLEYFNLHVNLAKAILHLRSFKYSLPRQIVNLLF